MNKIPMMIDSVVWILVTLVCYGISLRLYRRSRYSGLLHPIIVSVVLVFGALLLSDTDIVTYQHSVQLIDWLLIPATISLAVPLFQQMRLISRLGWKLIVPIVVGGTLAPVLVVIPLYLFGLDEALLKSAAVKSITTPLAIESSVILGGFPSVSALIVILTGLIGASCSTWVFAYAKVKSPMHQGLALGTIAHAVGVAHASRLGEKSVGFATLALCVNGIITSITLSVVFWLFLI